MINKDISVQGMSCNHCVMTVTEALKKLDGVKEVQVSLEENMVNVSYDESLSSLDLILKTIEEQGYSVV